MQVKVFHIRLIKEHLQTDQENLNKFLASVAVKKTSAELVTGQLGFWSILVFYNDKKLENQETISEKASVTVSDELTAEEEEIFKALKKWRYNVAKELNLPRYMICHNAELMEIAKVKPQTLEQLSNIKGFGRQKMTKFGDDIIALLNSF